MVRRYCPQCRVSSVLALSSKAAMFPQCPSITLCSVLSPHVSGRCLHTANPQQTLSALDHVLYHVLCFFHTSCISAIGRQNTQLNIMAVSGGLVQGVWWGVLGRGTVWGLLYKLCEGYSGLADILTSSSKGSESLENANYMIKSHFHPVYISQEIIQWISHTKTSVTTAEASNFFSNHFKKLTIVFLLNVKLMNY